MTISSNRIFLVKQFKPTVKFQLLSSSTSQSNRVLLKFKYKITSLYSLFGLILFLDKLEILERSEVSSLTDCNPTAFFKSDVPS